MKNNLDNIYGLRKASDEEHQYIKNIIYDFLTPKINPNAGIPLLIVSGILFILYEAKSLIAIPWKN